jgi:hypothetical protein
VPAACFCEKTTAEVVELYPQIPSVYQKHLKKLLGFAFI